MKFMKLRGICKGLLTYVPGVYKRYFKPRGTGGTLSAEYCYGVWLKHITMLWESGIERMPRVVAELGPGGSLGVGLAALLSGVDTYYALDVVEYVDRQKNLAIFEELVQLFKKRGGRPVKGWPDFDASLDARLFPSHILTDDLLVKALAPTRIAAIREALSQSGSSQDITIKYIASWNDPQLIQKASVDIIFSHAVLEHVDDLETTYKAFADWLKPMGFMSHQIDFTSHGTAEQWNGHWTYPELLWKLVVGKRPYLINRQPCSIHYALLEKYEFEVREFLQRERADGIKRTELAPRWKSLSETDFTTSSAFVIARKVS